MFYIEWARVQQDLSALMTSIVQLQAHLSHILLSEPMTSIVQLQLHLAHITQSKPMTNIVKLQHHLAHITLSEPMTNIVKLQVHLAHIALSEPMTIMDQQGLTLGSCSTFASLNPLYTPISCHWSRAKSCLVGGSDK